MLLDNDFLTFTNYPNHKEMTTYRQLGMFLSLSRVFPTFLSLERNKPVLCSVIDIVKNKMREEEPYDEQTCYNIYLDGLFGACFLRALAAE